MSIINKKTPLQIKMFLWGGCQNDIISILSDKDYMSSIKNKIRAIETYKE